MLIPSGPTAVDDLAKLIASSVSAGLKDGASVISS